MLFYITVTDTKPGRAAGIANGIASILIANQQAVEAKRRQLAEAPLRAEMEAVQQSISAIQQTLRDPTLTATQIDESKATLDQLQQQYDALSQTLQSTQQEEALNTVSLSVSDPAQPNTRPTRPNLLANMAVALPCGLLLGLLLALARGYLDLRVTDAEAVTRITGWPVLATASDLATLAESPADRDAEVTGVWMLDLDRAMSFLSVPAPLRAVAFAGTRELDGASALVAQYARHTAGKGVRTLLVEANLRHPTQATRFRRAGHSGVSDALLELQSGVDVGALASRYVHDGASSDLSTLSVLTAGAPVPNPGQLVASQAMGALFGGLLASDAQAILLDVAPLGEWKGTEPLVESVDGVLIVLQRVSKPALERLRARLAQSDATILGCVLVGAPRSRGDAASVDAADKRLPAAPARAQSGSRGRRARDMAAGAIERTRALKGESYQR